MAEDTCISVKFEDDSTWDYCWEDGHPSPSWKSEDVTTGLRPGQGTQSRAWRTCQYYLKGMPAICEWWTEGAPADDEDTVTSGSFFCSFIKENTSDNPQDPPPETPTGFNNTHCDFLGRRQWCSKYSAGQEDNLDEWICAGPNPYITGLGEKSIGDEAAIFTPVARKDIWGFNDKDDGTGTGMCDCYGMGRGSAGCAFAGEDKSLIEKNLSKLPIVCNYYRPYQMGFGVIAPSEKSKGDVDDDGVTITDQGWKAAKEWEDNKEYRLPLNYELYNARARFQKCHWWDEDTSRDFYADTGGFLYLDGDPEIFDEATGKVEFCKCTDTNADDFNHRFLTNSSPNWESSQFAIEGVWARGGGPICNGARPDCPCYSGKWKYLEQEKMLPGMPVTANQILELRFWSQDWDSQQSYDDYFEQRPNFDDPETPAIYTFTKWKRSNSDDYTYKMLGKKLTLCQPAPLHQKEFTTEYIIEEPADYYTEKIGTSTVGGQRYFPSLVRNNQFPELKPLVVTYPYYNDEVFNVEICSDKGPAGNTKRHNNIYGDAVKTVGQTIRNKTVYTINTNEIPVHDTLTKFNGVYDVANKKIYNKTAESIRLDIYSIIRETISRAVKDSPDYIKYANSDIIFGYFLIDGVKLDYNQTNKLLICVDYGDGTWEYRWRKVVSKWYGGVIKQVEYNHLYPKVGGNDPGFTNPMPEGISPSATATAQIVPLGSQKESLVDVYSVYSRRDFDSGREYYSYSIQEITEEESLEQYWGAVGNTNKIWLELSNININYIHTWDIESAELRVIIVEGEEDELGTGTDKPARGDDLEKVVQLKKILVDDDHIPPNACLLEPIDNSIRIRFLPSEWELYVTYTYERLTDEEVSENVVHGANRVPDNIYYNPHSMNYDGNTVTFADVSNGSMQLMAYFKDENERVISAFATKLIANIIRESCRSVDIYYAYEAEGRQYKLMPEVGFCIDLKQDLPMDEPYKHVEIPNCGDHEYSIYSWQGPMWFPYNTCRGYDMYDEFTVCNNCQAGYVGPSNDGVKKDSEGNVELAGGMVVKRNDYRYCGPHKYDAFGDTRGNWAAGCDCGCRFWYSDASAATVVFVGRSLKKATVDLEWYRQNSWAPPPFGNEGRELVEKYISQDYFNHSIPYMRNRSFQRNEWVPMMIDHSIFFSTFNAYDDNPEDEYLLISEYYGLEPFRYVNQLNMGLLSNIDEEIVQEEDPETGLSTGVTRRFRWEELFEVHHEANCSYPEPAYALSGNITKALFYYLKLDWHAWAWQEDWGNIERDVEGDSPVTAASDDGTAKTVEMGKLNFLELERPLYLTDVYKAEHRRIVAEGEYILAYTGPVMDERGNMVEYPSINFYGGNDSFRRPFKIMYPEDKYNTTKVTWAEEGGDLNTQGSANEDNTYETAMGSEWLHSIDILFDSEASSTTAAAAAAGRKVVSSLVGSEEVYSYYNRGLIVNMTRDRLYHLPKKETKLSYNSADSVNGTFEDDDGGTSISTVSTGQYPYKNQTLVPGSFVWQEDFVSITSQSTGFWSFARLHIIGNWGYAEGQNIVNRPATHVLVIPGVSISCAFENGSSGAPLSQTTSSTSSQEPEEGQAVETYDIYLDFLLGPVEMLTKRTVEFTINLEGIITAANSFISINEINLYKADYVDVQYEYIYTWERKYVASKFTDIGVTGVNLDGVGDVLHYQSDIDNSGQYFNFRGAGLSNQEVSAIDKTKAVSCGIYHPSDESVPDVTYDNLHDIESSEQRSLYEYAYERDLTGDDITYGRIIPYKYKYFLENLGLQFPVGDLVVTSEKLPWEKHTLYQQFAQYEYWRPGGHFYTWDANFKREKCMLFGGTDDYFQGYYAHVGHIGIGNPLESDSSRPIDPGNSYYSLRFYVQQAKYDRAMILAGGDPEYTDKWSASTLYNAPTSTDQSKFG